MERDRGRTQVPQLEERVRCYEAILSSIEDFVFLVDPSGQLLYANKALLDFWGVDLEEAVGKQFEAPGYTPDQLKLHRERVTHVIETGQPLRASHEYTDRNGTHGFYEYIFVPVFDDGGTVTAVAGVTRNVTRSIRLEHQHTFLLGVSQALSETIAYDDVLKTAATLAVPFLADICIIEVRDPDGLRLEFASAPGVKDVDAFVEQHRIGTEESLMAFSAGSPLLLDADRNEVDERDRTQAAKASIMVLPLHARNAMHGVMQLIGVPPRPHYTPDDLRFAQRLAVDVTTAIDNALLFRQAERARAEAERRARQEAALHAAAAQVTAAFTVEEATKRIADGALTATDADGSFVQAIDASSSTLTVVAATGELVLAVGTRIPFRGSVTEHVLRAAKPEIIPRGGGAEMLPPHLRRICPECSIAVIPLLDAGESVGSLFLVRGTEKQDYRPDEIDRAFTFGDLASLALRKIHLYEESERRRRELHEVTDSRARLMRGFSHDVKNPLGAADGYLQLLEEGIGDALGTRQAEAVAGARRNIRTALKLIEDLLEFARTETGDVAVRIAVTDVREAARDIVGEFRAQAEAKGLELGIDVPDELPLIDTDPARVRQIISNLISNAIKYTNEGHVSVRVDRRTNGRDNGRGVIVAVEDTGVGISPEQQRLLFREFTRLQPEVVEGAGVGLAIARRIAHALHGDIDVESEPGRGSTFTLWLPETSNGQSPAS